MKKQLKITGSKILTTGTKNGRPWILYKVAVEDPIKEFTTFNDLTNLVGQVVEVDVEERVNGQYKNWTQVSGKPNMGAMEARIKVLEERVDKLEANRATGQIKPSGGIQRMPKPVGYDDIPTIETESEDLPW